MKRVESTLYFVAWREGNQATSHSGFGYADKAKAIEALKELVQKQAHRNNDYPDLTWIGIRTETVINEYISADELLEAAESE